jgi:hypothetical protein
MVVFVRLLLPDYQNRAAGVPENGPSHRTEQQTTYAAAAVGSDDDEVRI